MQQYTVQKGDTLWAIGRKYGINWRYIAKINEIPDPNKIYVGQKIKIFGNQLLQIVIGLLEQCAYISKGHLDKVLMAIQWIINGSNWNEIKTDLTQFGIEVGVIAILARLHPYAAVAGIILFMMKAFYNRFFSKDEK